MSIVYMHVLIAIILVTLAVWIFYTVFTIKYIKNTIFYSNRRIAKHAVPFYIRRGANFYSRVNLSIKYYPSSDMIPIIKTVLHIRNSSYELPKELNNLVRIIIMGSPKFLNYISEVDRSCNICTTVMFKKVLENKKGKIFNTKEEVDTFKNCVFSNAKETMANIFSLLIHTSFLMDKYKGELENLPDSWQKLYYREVTVSFEKY